MELTGQTLLLAAMGSLTDPLLRGLAASFVGWVFVVSSVAKLRRPALAAMALVDFGVTRRVHPEFGVVLGGAELALALSLLAPWSREPALPLTAVVLVFFTMLHAIRVRRAAGAPCFCFGAASVTSVRSLLGVLCLALVAVSMTIVPPIAADVDADAFFVAVPAAAVVGCLALLLALPRALGQAPISGRAR